MLAVLGADLSPSKQHNIGLNIDIQMLVSGWFKVNQSFKSSGDYLHSATF